MGKDGLSVQLYYSAIIVWNLDLLHSLSTRDCNYSSLSHAQEFIFVTLPKKFTIMLLTLGAATRGGLWDFTGCGFGQFWPSGFGFSLKNMRVFGFWILDGSRVLSFFELGFRVLQLKCAGFRVSDVTRVLNFWRTVDEVHQTIVNVKKDS